MKENYIEQETVTTKVDYDLHFLYDVLEMIKGTFCIIDNDKKLYRLFMDLFNYIDMQLELPYNGDITEMCLLITQKKQN